jgi:hypothetical protein
VSVTALWGVRGGAGVTTVAIALAVRASAGDRGALLVDLAGDIPSLVGPVGPGHPGVAEWLRHRHDWPDGCWVGRTLRPTGRLDVAPRGLGALEDSAAGRLWSVLRQDPREVLVDCGQLGVADLAEPVATTGHLIARRAARSVLVTRACALSMRRLRTTPLPITGVVVIREPGRTLGRAEIEAAADAPVLVELPYDPAVARAVDEGDLAGGLPTSLSTALEPAGPAALVGSLRP